MQISNLTHSVTIGTRDVTLLYDFEGTDSHYGVHVESGMYGKGSKFAYKKDQEIHLNG